MFHPAWIPDAVDPSVEQLKRVRIIAGAVAALGVHTFVGGGFRLRRGDAFGILAKLVLSLTMGIFFILGAPVTVTGIALLGLRRLRQRYGVRLVAHPAVLPRIAPPPPAYAPRGSGGFIPPGQNPYGNPYGSPYGNPYGGRPRGTPSPYNPRNPYGG